MKRREFIEIAAVGVAGVVLPTTSCAEGSLVATLAHPRLMDVLRDENLVRELGGLYRANVPGENNPATLAQMILGEPLASVDAPLARPSSETVLRTRLDDQVQRDFAGGRTVTLDGWILSVTEARQCALFSLLPA